MNATETLRAMLDERDVEWKAQDGLHEVEDCEIFRTWWNGNCFYEELYSDGESYTLLEARAVEHITPEQAVEATLGRGACRFKTVEQFIDTRRSRSDICECDRCGYRCARGFIHDERFKYCPNCGARIEVGTHERA